MAFVDIAYDTLWSVRNRIFTVQIGMVPLIASETFSWVINSSFVSVYESRKWKFPLRIARTTSVNEPDKYGETIAVVYEHTKRTREMLIADVAQ